MPDNKVSPVSDADAEKSKQEKLISDSDPPTNTARKLTEKDTVGPEHIPEPARNEPAAKPELGKTENSVPEQNPGAAAAQTPASNPDSPAATKTNQEAAVAAAPETNSKPPDTAIPAESRNGTPDSGITTQPTSVNSPRRSSLKPQQVHNHNISTEYKPKKRVSFTPEYTQKPATTTPPKTNETSNSRNKPDQNPNNNNNDSSDGVITKQPSSTKSKNSKVAPVQDPLILLKKLENISSFFFKRCYEPVPAQANFSDLSFKFNIFDACGNRLFIAAELGKCCRICCCRTDRCFRFLILNPEGETIFVVKRSCGCCCCCGAFLCGDMCGQKLTVELENGMLLGEVSQLCRCCRPIYVIKNSLGAKVFRLIGPCWGFCFCCRVCCAADFRLLTFEPLRSTKKRVKLGRVSMDWDFDMEAQAIADGFMFGASFPTDLDVRLKATLLGASILIDFLHYEKDPCGPSQFCC